MICDNCILNKICEKNCINLLNQISEEYISKDNFNICPLCGINFYEKIHDINCIVFTDNKFVELKRDYHSRVSFTSFIIGMKEIHIGRMKINNPCEKFDKNNPKNCWKCLNYIEYSSIILYLINENNNKIYMVF